MAPLYTLRLLFDSLGYISLDVEEVEEVEEVDEAEVAEVDEDEVLS